MTVLRKTSQKLRSTSLQNTNSKSQVLVWQTKSMRLNDKTTSNGGTLKTLILSFAYLTEKLLVKETRQATRPER